MWRYCIDRTYPPWIGGGAERQSPAPRVDAQKAPPPHPAVLRQALAALDPANYPARPRQGGNAGTGRS